MPGMQKPHWMAPVSRNASCRRLSRPPSSRPSIVVTSMPPASTARTRQEFTARPSISTVHAPHSPSAQHSLLPVRSRSHRRASSSVSLLDTSTERATSLTVRSTGYRSARSGVIGSRSLALSQGHIALFKSSGQRPTAEDEQHRLPVVGATPDVGDRGGLFGHATRQGAGLDRGGAGAGQAAVVVADDDGGWRRRAVGEAGAPPPDGAAQAEGGQVPPPPAGHPREAGAQRRLG